MELTTGYVSVGALTATTAAFSSSDATDNTGAISYQWYLSITPGFTPGAGNILAGQTALTGTATGLTAGTAYYLVLKYTDSLTSVFSAQQSFTPGVDADFGFYDFWGNGRAGM